MTWTKLLLIPQVMALAIRAPRDAGHRWDQYWASVQKTGAHGDVLWDADNPAEARLYLHQLRRHSDTTLPVIDVGCGNGRYTRVFADTFPFALGVDLSPRAITRATQESRGVVNVAFRAMDLTAPGAGRRLAAEFGEVNLFVRGVLHVLNPVQRKNMAGNLRELLGVNGTLLLAETCFPGRALDYLGHLGATPTGVPPALRRVLAAGLPRPRHFGATEKAQSFPASSWNTVAEQATIIHSVPIGPSDEPGAIPGFLAVLRPRGLRSLDTP